MNMAQIAEKIHQRAEQGAVTLNLLGGEPAVNTAGYWNCYGKPADKSTRLEFQYVL